MNDRFNKKIHKNDATSQQGPTNYQDHAFALHMVESKSFNGISITPQPPIRIAY